jgi:DNA invertase Pin-like site-specific DNA recombinase
VHFYTRLPATLLGAIAECETALRQEQQLEGIAHTKGNGVRFSRQRAPTPGQVEELRQRRARGERVTGLMQA